jgi:hypothetical protein
MSVEGNEGFLEIPNASLRVSGNVHAEGIKLGVVELIPSYDLASVSNVGNTTSNTVQFTNPTTSLVASSNIVMLNTANTAQNVELSVGNRSNAYTKMTKLFSDITGIGTDDRMGACIAISGDGKVIVGSAPYDEAGAGAVYIFTQNSLGEWQRVQKVSDGDENFGGYNFHGSYPSPESLSLSNDGSILVVGNQYSNQSGVGDGGMAVIYTRVGATWSLTQKIFSSDIVASDYFGSGVDVSGDGSTIVVGAPAEDPGGTGNQGSAYIFQKVGGTWTQVQKLVQSDSLSNGFFGSKVRLSDDGTTLVVGAYGHDEPYVGAAGNTGAAYIFEKGGGGTWSQTLKLYPTLGGTGNGGGEFGHGLDISGDGNVIAVGAPRDDTTRSDGGSVYMYVKTGAAWSASPTQVITPANLEAVVSDNYHLGWSIALSQNGEHMVVGAIGDDGPTLLGGAAQSNAGAIHLYKRTNGVWTYVKEQRSGQNVSTSFDGATMAFGVGYCVAMSHDGQIYLTGSPHEEIYTTSNVGSVLVYNEKIYLERTGRLNVNSNFIAQNPVFFVATSNRVTFDAGTSGTTSTIIFAFNVVNINVGEGYDPQTGVFTAPITGYYKFDYNVSTNNDGTTRWYITSFVKNGLRVQASNTSTGYHTQMGNLSGQIVIDLEAGDTLAVAVIKGFIDKPGGTFTGFYLSA